MSNYAPPTRTRPQTFDDAREDARKHGAGWLKMRPDGTVERVDPRLVQVNEDAGDDGPSDALIEHMVSRFLGWQLPDTFNPDAGIRFEPEYNVEWNEKQGKPPSRHTPYGTNLFNATEAEAMIRHMFADLS